MNRFRLIDEVSIHLLDRNNCHISLLYFKSSVTFSKIEKLKIGKIIIENKK